jgi:hypothetical protein
MTPTPSLQEAERDGDELAESFDASRFERVGES